MLTVTEDAATALRRHTEDPKADGSSVRVVFAGYG